MPNRSPYEADVLFAEQCLEGNATALRELQESRAEVARGFLAAAGMPWPQAFEAVAELLSELLASDGAQSPLLAQYQGQCSLETWLNRAALSRAISRRRSEDRYRKRLVNAHLEGALHHQQRNATAEADDLLRKLLRDSIQQALDGCAGDDFVIIHLLFASNLHATEVARMFRCDPRTLRDKADAACAKVRFAVEAELRQRDPWLHLSWPELLNLLVPDLPPLFEAREPAT